jgi:hypothetical protein
MTENHDDREHGHHEHEHHSVAEVLREKPALSAILFDLRSVIGLLFVVYGLVLTILGIIGESPEDLAKSGGLALNLWTGLAMLIIGIAFYVWAFTKPPLPPDQDHSDHYDEEGGPLTRGHGH